MRKLPQDVEEFIAAHLREDPVTIDQFIDVDDLRAWMTGHARVPVELLRFAINRIDRLKEFASAEERIYANSDSKLLAKYINESKESS